VLFASAAESDLGLWWTIAGLLLLPLLVAINGFFVASEFALVSIRRTRVEEMVNSGVPKADSLMEAVDRLDRSVAAAQLGITLASLALGLVSEPILHALILPVVAPLCEPLPDHWEPLVIKILSISAALALVTFMHVVFGEQMPKIAALQASERIGLWIARPTNWFAKATHPLIRLMNGSSNFFLKRLGFNPSSHSDEVHTVNELRLLIEDTEEAGLIDPEAADFVRNVFELSNKKVQDVMIPWAKVRALELTLSPEKVLEAVRDGVHTRLPIYEKDPMNIVGIVNTKDLFFLFSLRGLVTLEDARYDAQFFDPHETVAAALRKFRKTKRPMAIVRDAAMVVHGIITVEDVLEEIIGDMEDEHDDPTRRRAMLARVSRKSNPGNRQLPKK